MFKSPRGTVDILPEEQKYWRFIERKAVEVSRLYGFERPQAQESREEIAKTIKETLAIVPEFSIVRKDSDIELHGPDWNVSAVNLQAKGVVEVIADAFSKLNISSITFQKGATASDIGQLLFCLNMPLEDLEKMDGLQGYLQNKKITHIKADQMRFQLLKEDLVMLVDL